MPINTNYFLPLLENVCECAKSVGEDAWPTNGVFIPYTFENYNKAPYKIMYVGRDTAGWVKFKEMMNDYQDQKLTHYIEKNSNVVTVQGRNEDGSDAHSLREGWNVTHSIDFWKFCQRLHLYIRTGREDFEITQLTNDEYDIIEEMGYGNLNTIEHDNTLKKGRKDKDGNTIDGDWYRINREKFYQIRQASREIDKLKHLLEAYNPDLIIILNWEERKDVFEGLSETWVEDQYIERIRAVYTLANKSTKILWTSHPNAHNCGSPYERIKLLGDTARNLLGIENQ